MNNMVRSDLCALVMQTLSSAAKGWLTVTYGQSLAFDHPYISCNDHCDRWLFQEIFFYYYFQKQLYADVLQNRCYKKFCNIHRKTSVLEPLFNMLWGLKLYLSLVHKETSTQVIPVKIAKFLRTACFMEHLWWLLLSVW